MNLECRLCLKTGTVQSFIKVDRPFKAKYFKCTNCDLVTLDEEQLLGPEKELSHYKCHENDKPDPGYTKFLYRCLAPTLKFLDPKMKGLDFGCGSYPMLAELMRKEHFEMDYYDPFFYPSKESLQDNYDFVTATEVVEHFHEPSKSWDELVSRVGKGGVLSVMTSLHSEDLDFTNWSYRFDHTHVSFYSVKTMNWIAQNHGLEVLEASKNVVIFKKL
ncbi:MAG: class I SAM-dependent methyltransferase [Bacteriovoracaceae bacterium]|nr:class I SAM-dependent methyltransferase [Bacteriovoracaceae bacterium]